MRSLSVIFLRTSALLIALTAVGCLVSEAPVLDARSGRGAPLGDGNYRACPVQESDSECALFTVTRAADGLYTMVNADESEAPGLFRFRRVARGAYAAQSEESGSFAYYFGRRDADDFTFMMMQCPSLPPALRARLIKRGDLESDRDDFETCTVKTRAGLVAAAKAYANGDVDLAEHPSIVMTRAPAPSQ